MVERAPEGADPEVNLTVVEPTKVPAAVGGGPSEEEGNTGDEAPGSQPAPPPPAADAGE